LGYWAFTGLILLAGGLAAKKTTDDLGAFRPGRLRLADLMVLAVSLIVVILLDLALASHFQFEPPAIPCRPPGCIAIRVF
jgi:hypothetical protein